MIFNINNCATVTLTKFGAEVYNKRYDDIPAATRLKLGIISSVKEGHILKAQLWTLFQDFGPYIMLGGNNPFKGCIMQFDENDFS